MNQVTQNPPEQIDTSEIAHYPNHKIRVLVGMTGSIDSLVAAFLLKKQGFQVYALALVTWDKKNPARSFVKPPNCFVENLDELKEICESADIAFYATDIKSRFDYEVLESTVGNKLTGIANISCFNCTKLRFQVLFEKMKKLKCHFMATGHFAKTYKNHKTNEFFAHSANDKDFDQSTFIAGLPQEILRKTLFPLSELKKDEVKKIAQTYKLDRKNQNDHKTMCFDHDSQFPTFIKTRVPEPLREPGNVHEIGTEKYIAEQDGVFNYHIGQTEIRSKDKLIDKQQGFEVVSFDYKEKIVYVGSNEKNHYLGAQVVQTIFSSEIDRTKPVKVYFKVNTNEQYYECVLFYKNNNTLYVEFTQPYYRLAESDKIVFYDRANKSAKILGFGFIATRGEYKKINRTKAYDKEKDDPFSSPEEKKAKAKKEVEFGF